MPEIAVGRQFRGNIVPSERVSASVVQPEMFLVQDHAANVQPRIRGLDAGERAFPLGFEHGEEQTVLEILPGRRFHAAVGTRRMQHRLVEIQARIVIDRLIFLVKDYGDFGLGNRTIGMDGEIAVLEHKQGGVQDQGGQAPLAFRQGEHRQRGKHRQRGQCLHGIPGRPEVKHQRKQDVRAQ